MEMKSEAGKEFEETRKSQEKEEMISIPSSTVMKSKNDEGNMATAFPCLWTAQKNPLLIDLILDVTLSNLSLKDLLSCRLVCQDWNRISIPKVKSNCPLRNVTKLTITDFGILSCSTFFQPGNELHLENLREFHFLGAGTSGNLNSGFFDGFFTAAQNLKKLSFGVKDYRLEYGQEFPSPNDFDFSSDEEGDFEGYENEYERFIPLEGMNENEEEGRRGLDDVLNSFLNHGRLNGIKSLTFHNLNNLNLVTLAKVGKKGLKLESFVVHGKIGFNSSFLCTFLKTQKNTLKTLEISGRGFGYPPQILWLRFPSEMKELRRLTLYNNGPLKIKTTEFNDPIEYYCDFPEIKQLYVESGHRRRGYRQDSEILDTFFESIEHYVGCETMKELRMVFTLSDQERIVEKEIIKWVSAIFPQIVVRVQVDRADDEEEDEDGDEENGQASVMTLKIFGD